MIWSDMWTRHMMLMFVCGGEKNCITFAHMRTKMLTIYIRSRLHIYVCVTHSGGGGPHLLSLPSHLPVVLLQLVVERLAARHQVLSADLARSLLPHWLVAFYVVLLLLLTVGETKSGEKKDIRTKPTKLHHPSLLPTIHLLITAAWSCSGSCSGLRKLTTCLLTESLLKSPR